MKREEVRSVGFLAGTAIGAGIFSLPYLFNQLGVVFCLLYLAVFGAVYSAVHFMYARVAEQAYGEHRFFFLAKKHFSLGVARLAAFLVIAELVFSLAVYIALAPSFFRLITPLGGGAGAAAFWLFGSLFVFTGASKQGWASVFGLGGILAIAAAVFFFGFGRSRLSMPIWASGGWPVFIAPFGPLLFSFAARPAVPDVLEERRKKKFSLLRVMALGSAVPALVYLVFVVGILRLGGGASPDALSGLDAPPVFLSLLGLLGFTALWTSYFVLGDDLKDILRLDFKVPDALSAALTIALPFLIYLFGLREFIRLLSFTGGALLAAEALFMVTMWRRAFPKHRRRWIAAPLYIVFAISLGYTLLGPSFGGLQQ